MPAHALGSDWKRLWAARQRSNGHYTRETLAAYFAAWRQRPTATNLLAWLAFRRDLGLPLPARFVPSLHSGLGQLDAARRRLALGMLAEAGGAAWVGRGLDARWLNDVAHQLPPFAAAVAPASELAQLAHLQTDWQRAFAAAFAAAVKADGVQLVGNAAGLQGRRLGQQLDAASWVVRFNQFAAGPEWQADVGERLDVWVVSPGYEGPVPAAVRWVVVSGPDVLFRLQNWSLFLPFVQRGIPVLTVPLPQWRWCVNTLQAPPSAGVLLLHWLHSLNGERHWQGIRSAGVGLGTAARQQGYHLVLPRQKPGHRHAWKEEARLMQRWAAEGLCRLDASASGSHCGPVAHD